MAVRNTTEAYVLWNGIRVAKVTDITPQESRQVLDTTGIGQFADTFTYGGYSGSISGTLLYDPADAATASMMNRIRSQAETLDTLRLVSKAGDTQGDITAVVLVGQQSVSVAAKGLMSAQISMTVNGPIAGDW
jgi:hypothetical protein